VFTPEGTYLTEFGSSGSGQLSFPTRVAINFDGDVYVLDAGEYRVQVFW
jgi:hypothetical protein